MLACGYSYHVSLTLTLRSSLRVTLIPLVAANLNKKNYLSFIKDTFINEPWLTD